MSDNISDEEKELRERIESLALWHGLMEGSTFTMKWLHKRDAGDLNEIIGGMLRDSSIDIPMVMEVTVILRKMVQSDIDWEG